MKYLVEFVNPQILSPLCRKMSMCGIYENIELVLDTTPNISPEELYLGGLSGEGGGHSW